MRKRNDLAPIVQGLRGLRPVVCVLALCAVASIVASAQQRPHRQMRYLMGTLCEITAFPVEGRPGESVSQRAARTEAVIQAAFEELKRIDSALSNWRPDSELMILNRSAGAETTDAAQNVPGGPAEAFAGRPLVSVSQELFERLQIALRVAETTGGRFDPTVGPLTRAWGFLPSAGSSDRAAEVQAARQRVGWEKVRLHPDSHSVQFAVAGMEIDLGGIAKGYAAQRAVEVLRQAGVKNALVNLGGSSIQALGSPANSDGWPVLVRDVRDGRTPVALIQLRDGEALATSGTYEKTVGEGTEKRSHILDPATGEAVAGAWSATVLLPDAEIADALSKPWLLEGGLETPASRKILEAYPNASVMLMAAPGRDLIQSAAGAQPERFLSPSGPVNHAFAAQANR